MKRKHLNAEGFLACGNPKFSNAAGREPRYRMRQLSTGNSGVAVREGMNMYEWLTQHGATNENGLPFIPGDIIHGTQNGNGNLQFTAYKNSQPFQTGWSLNYFTPLMMSGEIPTFEPALPSNNIALELEGGYNPNPPGSVIAEATALAAQNVQFNSEGNYGGQQGDRHHHRHGQGTSQSNQSTQQGQGSQKQPGEITVTPSFTAPIALQAYTHLKVIPYSSTQYQALSGKLKSSGSRQTFTGTQMLINMSDVTVMPPHSNAEGEGDATAAPVNPILAPEMITDDKTTTEMSKGICLPCTGSIIGLALGLGAAYYVSTHPALSKFHLKNNILQYSVYGLAVGVIGYGIGFGIKKLK